MSEAKWLLRNQVLDEESPISMPGLVWRALSARGIRSKDQVESFFSPSLSQLKNPFSMLNMDVAAQRLVEAHSKDELIAVYADFDLDGTSGLALLYEGLKALGYKNIMTYQPKRLSEGYGLHTHAIEELASSGVRVIVTVDVGITAVSQANRAKELGVDLIITDHHQPGEKLPEAYAVVNPNQKACTSGLGYLCGAGVAFYFLLAVRKLLADKNIKTNFNPKDVLDFFVIGTLTDLVPLVEDNRVLIKHGLSRLSQTQRPALRCLLNALGFEERSLTSQDVAIQVAPKLNALSRMETEYLPRHVLLETEVQNAQKIVSHVLETQELRKSFQKNAVVKALSMAEEMSQDGYCWVWSHEFHKGVIGLVATQLCEKLRVPSFVGSLNEEGIIVGSARIPDGSERSLVGILDFCTESLLQHGGHHAAAGFKLDGEKALEFDAYLSEYFETFPQDATQKILTYDAVAKLNELTPQLMNWLYALEPYGKDFPQFLFRIDQVKILRKKELNGGHLKWTFEDESGVSLEGLMFSPKESVKNKEVDAVVSVLVEPQWNHFNGVKRLQLMVKDIL